MHEVESVYNLTERDFDDLKLYHLGPCRALPSYLLNPQHWQKVLPKEFIRCRTIALERASQTEGVPFPVSNEKKPVERKIDVSDRQTKTPYQQPMPINQNIQPQQRFQSGYSHLPYPPTPGSVLSDPNSNVVQQQSMNGYPLHMQVPMMQQPHMPIQHGQQPPQPTFINLKPLPKIPEPATPMNPMLSSHDVSQ